MHRGRLGIYLLESIRDIQAIDCHNNILLEDDHFYKRLKRSRWEYSDNTGLNSIKGDFEIEGCVSRPSRIRISITRGTPSQYASGLALNDSFTLTV